MSCSHKKGVLQFIDQLISFYVKEYMLSSGVTESYQSLIDKVLQLADANGLPSKGYESFFPGFSAEVLRGHLNKVCSLLLSPAIKYKYFSLIKFPPFK